MREDLSANENQMHYVGFCRICKTGPLGLRICGACEAISIMCDECDSVWSTPDLAAPPITARGEVLPCPTCGASLHDASAHWARRAEIAARAWLQTAIDGGTLELKQGTPLE